jgi:hypothetical protein
MGMKNNSHCNGNMRVRRAIATSEAAEVLLEWMAILFSHRRRDMTVASVEGEREEARERNDTPDDVIEMEDGRTM